MGYKKSVSYEIQPTTTDPGMCKKGFKEVQKCWKAASSSRIHDVAEELLSSVVKFNEMLVITTTTIGYVFQPTFYVPFL
jgi:hypothetical protein